MPPLPTCKGKGGNNEFSAPSPKSLLPTLNIKSSFPIKHGLCPQAHRKEGGPPPHDARNLSITNAIILALAGPREEIWKIPRLKWQDWDLHPGTISQGAFSEALLCAMFFLQ